MSTNINCSSLPQPWWHMRTTFLFMAVKKTNNKFCKWSIVVWLQSVRFRFHTTMAHALLQMDSSCSASMLMERSSVVNHRRRLALGASWHRPHTIIIIHRSRHRQVIKLIKPIQRYLLDGFLAVGSLRPANVKAEIYDFAKDCWTETEDYPFATGPDFFKYDMVYVPATLAYYIIGGASSVATSSGTEMVELKQIAMFKNGVWTDAGQLNTGRRVSFCSYFLNDWFNFKGPSSWMGEWSFGCCRW